MGDLKEAISMEFNDNDISMIKNEDAVTEQQPAPADESSVTEQQPASQTNPALRNNKRSRAW